MNGLVLWWRRTWWVGVLLLAGDAVAMTRSMVWRWDWSWMLSILAGATLLASPALAGAAAAVVLRLFPTDARDVTSVSAKPWAPFAHITAAVWLHAMTAWGLVGAMASVVCVVYAADSKAVVHPWAVLLGPVALLAAAAAGVLGGQVVRSPWVVPVLVLALFLGHRPTYWTSLPEVFTLKQATGSFANAGFRPIAAHLIATSSANLLVAGSLILVSIYLSSPIGLRHRQWLLAAVLLLGGVGVILGWGWAAAYEPIPT